MTRPNPDQEEPVLVCEDLHCRYHLDGSHLRRRNRVGVGDGVDHAAVYAVNGISITLRPRQRLAIIGESGSGKTTLCMALVGLAGASAEVAAQKIRWANVDVTPPAAERNLHSVRGRVVGYVFQNAIGMFHPHRTIGASLRALVKCRTRRDSNAAVVSLLASVGFDDPETVAGRLPRELSGGMARRVAVAAAIADRPAVVIADEPTAGLDVESSCDIAQLFHEMQHRDGTAIIFATHEIDFARRSADTLLVMYGGLVVEEAPTAELFETPRHPYAHALFRAVPTLGRAGTAERQMSEERQVPVDIPGNAPRLRVSPVACPFSARCPRAVDRCYAELPPLSTLDASLHSVRCWNPRSDGAGGADPGFTPSYEARPTAATGRNPFRVSHSHSPGADRLTQSGRGDGPRDGDRRRVADLSSTPESVSSASSRQSAKPVFRVRDLTVSYPKLAHGLVTRRIGSLRVLDGVSFDLGPAQILGVVGATGSGKSTLVRSCLRLEPEAEGKLYLGGRALPVGSSQFGAERHRLLQFIPQDPFTSLDPVYPTHDVVAEPLHVLRTVPRPRRHGVACGALRETGTPSDLFFETSPALSGGQRQRVAVARAIVGAPAVVFADEPVSSLDASLRGRVLRLFQQLRDAHGFSFVVVSHDLAALRAVADTILVLDGGRVAETTPVEQFFSRPQSPAGTAMLHAALSGASPADSGRAPLAGSSGGAW